MFTLESLGIRVAKDAFLFTKLRFQPGPSFYTGSQSTNPPTIILHRSIAAASCDEALLRFISSYWLELLRCAEHQRQWSSLPKPPVTALQVVAADNS